ncbi:MAG: HlyD family efflux transporter periplasmic adaptor subunit [Alphaproteobacteria bacterium]|nr:HlyD family efflux transporter periplasmic adaptor subunit [Alphaproteobacteria bacterium]
MLSRWDAGDVDALVQRMDTETTLGAPAKQVADLASFLQNNGLTRVDGPNDLARLVGQAKARRHGWLTGLMHHYLFFRIPLIRPDRFLRSILPLAAPLYSRGFLIGIALAGVLGLYMVSQQWDAFVTTFVYTFNLQGMLWYGLALSAAKIIHELGHALTLRRYGGAVPTMGVAFLVMWPVLYTDTASAWMLRSRKERLAVVAGGIVAELMLAVLALLSWSFLSDGPARTAAFLLSTVTLVGTLAINSSPMMRFDGYYFVADLLGVANLQDRSFALARWRLRQALLGLEEPPPEILPPGLRRNILLYAYATWIYRLVLFLGIAIIVYHFFFKALGIVMFSVEIGWFVIRPFWREFSEWWQRRKHLRLNAQVITTLAGFAGLTLLLFVPWRGVVEAPGTLQAGERVHLYPPFPGRIDEIFIQEGDEVVVGQPILRLATPDLDHQAVQAKRTTDILRWQIERQGAHAAFLEQRQVLEEQLASASTDLASTLNDKARATVRVPLGGRVMDVEDGLQLGRWMSVNDHLAVVVADDGGKGEAFAPEADLGDIASGMRGHFVPDDPDLPQSRITIITIDTAAARSLSDPSLASVFGGPIAVVSEAGEKVLLPRETVYRIQFRPDDKPAYPQRTVRGRVLVNAEPRSIANKIWRSVAVAVMRESGF